MTNDGQLDSADREVLLQVVTEACLDLLGALGCAPEIVPSDAAAGAREHELAGFIGFTGEVRGSLVIAGSGRFFGRTHPAGEAAAGPTEIDHYDWTCEVANQLLGRIKRRFCLRGRDFEASTPTAIAGRDLGRRFGARVGTLDLVFAAGDDRLAVYFEVQPPSEGRIFPESAQPIGCSEEGDMVLF